MAISRSLMNRQLRASGGIMDVTPRENFGFGSSLKKFVRKIIPNEVADIAVKAAPFVAPFNPALAGVMSAVGTFDQTGSISAGLKSGAMNYGGGQLARYAGGAGFQGNPFGDGGAFTGGLQGFKGGFSSPIGTETGLGKFFSNRGTEGVQGINSGRGGDSASALSRSTANAPTEALAAQGRAVNADSTGLFAEGLTGGTEVLANEVSLVPNAIIDKSVVAKEPGFLKNMFDGISNQDYGKVAKTIGDGAKKFGKAMFTNKDGSIDKAAVLGAAAFTASYAEAKALAADAGVEITPEEYDESRKAEKQEEYAGYLTNFFGGQKDGGRIGYALGTPKDTTMFEELNVDTIYRPEPESTITLPEEMPGDDRMAGSQGYDEQYNAFIELRDTFHYREGDSYSEANRKAKQIVYGMKDGGRVNRRFGSPEEGERSGVMEMLSVDVDAGGDDEEEDMKMAGITFSSAEKSYLFKKLGGAGGSDRSFTMPQLYRVLSNPDRYAEDAAVLKEIAIMGLGKKDGGRIGYKGGANRVSELLILRDSLLANGEDVSDIEAEIFQLTGKAFKSVGGISDIPTGQMRKNNAGVVERDYRDEGGFVPVGIKERADDVPAMLSKNEFVMTADAVRGIGNGSVEEGSKKLYNTMKQAEQVGKA